MKTFRIFGLTSLLFTLAFASINAQNDPLQAVQSKVVNDNLYKARALKMTPAIKTKLSVIETEVKSKRLTFEVGYTEALDRTPEELLGAKPPKAVSESAIKQQEDMNLKISKVATQDFIKAKIAVPNVNVETSGVGAGSAGASWWAGSYGYLSPIRNQGGCGSCWAFASAAAYETAFKKFYSKASDLSEQDIVNCGKTCSGVDAGSCSGGWSDRAFDYIRCTGTTNESSKPYAGVNQACTVTPKVFRAYYWGQLSMSASRATIQNYIKSYGSVVTYMRAGISSFYAYKGGVYNGYASNGNPNDIDHAVTIVGWNDALNAWIIRNSWGTTWGIGGYAYVNYNACNIGKYNYYVYPMNSGLTAPAPGTIEASPIIVTSH